MLPPRVFVKPSILQRGLSLLEMMLSMAIGLLLLMALGALMVTSNRMAISRSTSERLDDNARQIFWRLEQDLRHAGYIDTFASGDILKRAINLKNDSILQYYLKNQEAPASEKSALHDSVLEEMTQGRVLPLVGCGSNDLFTDRERVCRNRETTTQQSLMVSYQALRSGLSLGYSSLSSEAQEGARGSDSGASEGCSGVSAKETEPLLTHIYGVHQGGLSCITIRNALNHFATTQIRAASQPIVGNVVEMMFRYLVVPEDEEERARLVNGQKMYDYLTAHQVEESALGWSAVIGVEVCLVLAGEPLDGRVDWQTVTRQSALPTCQRAERESREPNALWAQGVERPAGDQKLYQRYYRILSLPNHLYLLNIDL